VSVRSDGVGAGSEFVVALPVHPSPSHDLKPHEGPDIAPITRALRILIADDNEDGREMLALYLKQKGHRVLTAADGKQALAMFREFKPDVALLDVGMPGMNGYKVAEAIRRQSGNGAPVLVALSGLGQRADKSHAKQSGFDRHFTKPVEVSVLDAFLRTVEPAEITAPIE
jgi:CheY-like chemotaxis protein